MTFFTTYSRDKVLLLKKNVLCLFNKHGRRSKISLLFYLNYINLIKVKVVVNYVVKNVLISDSKVRVCVFDIKK